MRVALACVLAVSAVLLAASCSSDESGGSGLALGCTLNSDCDRGLVCTFERCHQECETTADCPGGQRCVQAEQGNSCQLPEDEACTFTSSCSPPLVCAVDSECRNECEGPRDCLPRQVCANGGFCSEADEVDESGDLHVDGGAASGGTGGTGSGGASGSGGTPPDAGAGGADAASASDGSSDAPADATLDVPILGEICGNGVDDDGDDEPDCADSECAGFECAGPVPVGFSGPVVYWEGPTGEEPDCAAPYDLTLLTGTRELSCGTASCPCTCEAPTGRSCGYFSVFVNPTNTCPLGNQTLSLNGNCQTPPGGIPERMTNSIFAATTPTGGSCDASPGTVTVPDDYAWAVTGRICGAPALYPEGCSGSRSCVPTPAGDYGRLCIYHDGDAECPSTGYTDKFVLYSDVDDSRGCSECTCGGATGGTCNQTVDLYSNTDCSGTPSGSLPQNASCLDVFNVQRVKYVPTVTNPGSCAPLRPPTGECTPTEPTTICCVSP